MPRLAPSRQILATLVIAALVLAYPAPAARAQTPSRTIASAGTIVFPSSTSATDADVAALEIDGQDGDDDGGFAAAVNRTITSGAASNGRSVNAGKKAKSDPQLEFSVNGLNFRDQRLADNGNQFSVEPPDQALCVGGGFVIESVNDVIQIFDTSGAALTSPVSLNRFYGYASAIDRTASPLRFGPSITDPVCYFDRATGRFFHVVLTLDRASPTTQALSGKNHLDIAVSNTSDPRGAWTIYKIAAQNDGTDGTPNHGCILTGGAPGPCLADYPHIGADRNGIYITTNEFSLAGPGFFGADIYALSKAELVAGAASVSLVLLETSAFPTSEGLPGFTVWPATTPGDQFSNDGNGTEYFVSSQAVFEDTDTSTKLTVWALSNTASLGTASPSLTLASTVLSVDEYGVPSRSTQKAGDYPLGQCLADPTCRPRTGAGGTAAPTPEGRLDSSDSRVTGVSYANGKLWAVLGTAATIEGANNAAIAWFVIRPTNVSGLSAAIALQGTLGLANTNLTYPSVAVTQSGRGAIGFTIVGPNDYPSFGYAAIDGTAGAGDVHTAAAGLGPQDGFTEYPVFTGGRSRPRWGDYGAAVADGKSIWLAGEYVGQTCTLAQYNVAGSAFGSCGGTRTSLGNWATRIVKLTP